MAITIIREMDASFLRDAGGVIHPEGFGVFLCTGGSCRLGIDDMAYAVERNMMFVFKPFAIIAVEYASPDIRGVAMELDVEKTMQLLNDISPEMRLGISQNPCLCPDEKQAVFIRRLLDMIREKTDMLSSAQSAEEADFSRKTTDNLIRSVCYEVFGIYSSGSAVGGLPASRGNRIFNRFIASVYRNCATRRLVEYYAGQQHISPGHFASVIREISGHSPAYWINLFTMTEIRRLLTDTDLSLKEIAVKMCFADQSVFGRYFRRHEGVSPAAFRAKA